MLMFLREVEPGTFLENSVELLSQRSRQRRRRAISFDALLNLFVEVTSNCDISKALRNVLSTKAFECYAGGDHSNCNDLTPIGQNLFQSHSNHPTDGAECEHPRFLP